MKGENKINSLQALRGIGILLIIVSHCNKLLFNSNGSNALNWFGAYGVSIFIMISGFLSSRKYLMGVSQNQSTLTRIKTKLKKLYPLHLMTLFFSLPLCLNYFVGNSENIISGTLKLVSNILLLQAWIPKSSVYFAFNLVSWYLSLVIFFTTIEPFICKKIVSLKPKKKYYVTVFLILIIELALVIVIPNNISARHWIIYICPLTRLMDYILGGLITCIDIKMVNDSIKKIYAIFGVVLIIFTLGVSTISNSEFFSTVAWSIPSINILVISLYCRDTNTLLTKVFNSRFLIYIGNISFELFLIHHLIIRYVQYFWIKLGLHINVLMYIIAIGISFGLSIGIRTSYFSKKYSKR